ncbi:MAG: hypothetical protein AAGA55_02410, partial [Planctomycetota bacterium]
HDHAARTVRRFTRCVARADGTPFECRYVIDGDSGELVLGIGRPAADAEELTLCLPDDTFHAEATLLVQTREAGEDQWTDRHMAYHPDARPPMLIRASVDSAKLRDGGVVPGEQLALVNPLRSAEPGLCKSLNADRAALGRLCRLMSGVEPDRPVAVGVDRFGIDVRGRFGVIRLDLPSPCEDPDEAGRVLAALIGGAA